MLEALPHGTDAARDLAADLIMTTMSTVGKEFSETPRSLSEIESYADAMADMFCAYVQGIAMKPPDPEQPGETCPQECHRRRRERLATSRAKAEAAE